MGKEVKGALTLEELQDWSFTHGIITKIRNNTHRFSAVNFGWSIPEKFAIELFGTDAYKFMLELSHATTEWVMCYDHESRQFYINDTGLKMMWWYRALKLFREVKDSDTSTESDAREHSSSKGATV